MAQVLDYSGARPGGARIAADGYAGVVRYLSTDATAFNRAKQLRADELADLHEHGLEVGLVWETYAERAAAGYDAGRADALEANRRADALGWPSSRPIYYAVDFDSAGGGDVADYFAGVAAAGGRPWGVYGEYDVIERFAGSTPWLWQCAAWSLNGRGSGGSIEGRRLSDDAVLFQRVAQVYGGGADVNDVLRPDWGGWHPSKTYDNTTPEDEPVTEEQMKQLGEWMQDQAKNVVALIDAKIDALGWGVVIAQAKTLEAIKAVQAGEPVDLEQLSTEIGKAVTDEIAKRLAAAVPPAAETPAEPAA